MEGSIELIEKKLEKGEWINTLFDPIQTHAVYGILSKENLNNIKSYIKDKKLGSHFRQIKTRYGSYILCFKIKIYQ